MNRYLELNNVWKYQHKRWIQQDNLRVQNRARLVVLENILLLVGGGSDKRLRYGKYMY